MTTIKLSSLNPNDYILAIRAAKSFASEDKHIGIRHGSCYGYGPDENDMTIMRWFYVYRTKTMIVVRYSN